MIYEKSCGAVVYAPAADGGREYLLIRMVKGHWGMPKGHVENGESETETAEREIREETGLTVRADTGFRAAIRYSPYAGCEKEVVYFTARSDSRAATPQPEEVRQLRWVALDTALALLTYDNDRDVLRQADDWLDGRAER